MLKIYDIFGSNARDFYFHLFALNYLLENIFRIVSGNFEIKNICKFSAASRGPVVKLNVLKVIQFGLFVRCNQKQMLSITKFIKFWKLFHEIYHVPQPKNAQNCKLFQFFRSNYRKLYLEDCIFKRLFFFIQSAG